MMLYFIIQRHLSQPYFIEVMHNDYDYLFKFILVGDSSVGKSCLLLRFLQSRFKNQHEPTLGVEFGAKMIHVDNRKIKLQVWDTAGQESFRSITRAYYRGSIAALMVFDLSSQITFESLSHWLREVKTHSHNKLRLCLIGNKSDLKNQRQVSKEAIDEFLQKNQIENYFQTSALTGQNSDLPFIEMSQIVMKAIDKGHINPEEDGALGVKSHPKKNTGLSPNIKAFSDLRESQTARQQREKQGCNC